MIFDPDAHSKTLRIPVRLNGGRFQLFHGGALPKIKVGAVADLIIESHYLEDAADVARMEIHKTVRIREKDAILMARVSTNFCESTHGLREITNLEPPLGYPVGFVPIQLEKPLDLTLVFGKSAHLNDCPCFLPTIGKEARSVNHAFTRASRHYETRRRSNGGNVFLSVYYEDGKVWRPLKDLRFKHEAMFEMEIARTNGELGI